MRSVYNNRDPLANDDWHLSKLRTCPSKLSKYPLEFNSNRIPLENHPLAPI